MLLNDIYIEWMVNGGVYYFLKYVGVKVCKVDVWFGIDLLSDFMVIVLSEINGKLYEFLDD